MAKYTGSVFGNISGKQGGVVASKWKGINYIRGYTIPANPDTPDQQSSRAKFKRVSQLLSYVNEIILKPFWSPIPKGKSAYNAAMEANPTDGIMLPIDIFDLKVHSGSMANVTPNAGASNATKNLVVTFPTTLNAGEAATDLIVVGTVKLDDSRFHAVGSVARSVGTITVAFDPILSTSEILNYVIFVVRADLSAGSDSLFTTEEIEA